MKFLTFNILVGAALAWLILGNDGAQALLASVTTKAETIKETAVACSPSAARMAGQGAGIVPAVAPGAEPVKMEPAAPTVTAALKTEDTKPASLLDTPNRGGGLGAAGSEAVSPAKLSAPATVPAPNRREALRALAEGMELFSLERIGK